MVMCEPVINIECDEATSCHEPRAALEAVLFLHAAAVSAAVRQNIRRFVLWNGVCAVCRWLVHVQQQIHRRAVCAWVHTVRACEPLAVHDISGIFDGERRLPVEQLR